MNQNHIHHLYHQPHVLGRGMPFAHDIPGNRPSMNVNAKAIFFSREKKKNNFSLHLLPLKHKI